MKPRTLLMIAPLAALTGLAVILRGEPTAVRGAAIIGLAYVAIVALAVARRRFPPASHSLRRDARPLVPEGNGQALMKALESVIELSRSSAVDYQRRLRPILIRVTIGRLAGRGVIWEREPEKVEALLGERAWRLLAPPDGFPDRNAPGASIEEVEEIVNRIEEV
jgi:hypothetical protein